MSKRDDYISWHEFFMLSAVLCSKRSKDPNTQVGSVIVNRENRILSTGYNGFTPGVSDNVNLWGKNTSDPNLSKYSYVVHSELNAILNVSGPLKDLRECTMYVTLEPCIDCLKAILQCGIRKIYYLQPYNKNQELNPAKTYMLECANATCEKIEINKTLHII